MPDFSVENKLGGIVAGIDEVGRGPWAGPVVAAAVILNNDNYPNGIDDSKKLSPSKRQILFLEIIRSAKFGVGLADVFEIDNMNILEASKLAMLRAYKNLNTHVDCVIVDGNQPLALNCKTYPLVSGDSISLSVAAASIIAKVTRDKIMHLLAKEYPHYGWESNVGYGTKQHQDGIRIHGITEHHRRSFKPIAKFVA